MKHVKRIFILVMLFIIAYFLLGQKILKSDVSKEEYRCEEFKGEWEWVKPDGSRSAITLPGKYKIERNEKMVIETRLPEEIQGNSYLCMRSAKQELRFFVDGELRKEYSTKDTRLFGKISAMAYVFFELKPEDRGKVFTLELQTDSSYSGVLYEVYYGNEMGIWHYFGEKYGAEILVAFMALAMGVISILVGSVLRMNYQKEIVFEYLGWGVFLAAIWLMANSVFRQLISPNLSVINDMAFLSLMMLPLPFLIFMNGIQKRRYEKLYLCFGVLLLVDFLICTLLHMVKVVDYTDSITYMAIVCSMALIAMGIGIGLDIKKGYIKEYFWVAMGILACVIAAFIQMAMYFQRTTTFSGAILAIGLIILLVFAGVNTMYEILQTEGEKQKAILASESKGKFLANMSHEIRTPINAILGMNAIVLRETRNQRIKEYSMDIQNAGQSLLALINDILDFSKIESGKLELLPVEYDFSSMIHDIVNMISLKVQAKELEFSLHVDETLPSRLWGDDVRIRQVLVNLLNNSVKYTEKGKISLFITGSVQEGFAQLDFKVADTGIGIKQEDISKLFEDFQRIEERRNRNIEGTGLGIGIVIQLLEMMDSKLEVQSVYGEGSTFSFRLMQKIMVEEPIGNLEERIRQYTAEYAYDVLFVAPKAKILVVDDNAVNRKVFVNLLKETKVQIEEASGGFQCLEQIKETSYDLIFMDHMMPEMDGVETLLCMREQQDHLCTETPVVALTANAIAGAKEMYLQQGFSGFISKPINPEKLEALLLEMLPKEKIQYQKQEEVVAEKGGEEQGLPEIEGIDWEYAMLHNTNIHILQETVQNYYEMIDAEGKILEGMFQQITENGERADNVLSEYRIKVHSMKSSASMIGALGLSGIAKILEYAARDGDRYTIETLTPVFLKQWFSYKELLGECVKKQEETREKTALDKETVLQLLEELEAAMEELEIDVADEKVEELLGFSYSEAIQLSVDKLKIAVKNLDEKEAGACMEVIRQRL